MVLFNLGSLTLHILSKVEALITNQATFLDFKRKDIPPIYVH